VEFRRVLFRSRRRGAGAAAPVAHRAGGV